MSRRSFNFFVESNSLPQMKNFYSTLWRENEAGKAGENWVWILRQVKTTRIWWPFWSIKMQLHVGEARVYNAVFRKFHIGNLREETKWIVSEKREFEKRLKSVVKSAPAKLEYRDSVQERNLSFPIIFKTMEFSIATLAEKIQPVLMEWNVFKERKLLQINGTFSNLWTIRRVRRWFPKTQWIHLYKYKTFRSNIDGRKLTCT